MVNLVRRGQGGYGMRRCLRFTWLWKSAKQRDGWRATICQLFFSETNHKLCVMRAFTNAGEKLSKRRGLKEPYFESSTGIKYGHKLGYNTTY